MIAAPILHTEARLIARHSAFAGFSIPMEANDTRSPAVSSFASGGASVAHLALCRDAALAAGGFPFNHATITSDEGKPDLGAL